MEALTARSLVGTQLEPLRPEAAWASARELTGCAQPSPWGRVHCWEGQGLLFGSLEWDEEDPVSGRTGATKLQSATTDAYLELFACLDARGYPNLARVWSYLPRINAMEDGLERYRQFNIGRQDAFLAHGRSVTETLPAASALGSHAGGLRIGFLATKDRVLSLESPRQVSAFNYPIDYGPRTPTFARASVLWHGGEPHLLVSGTASIVGHRSLHCGDPAAQARETITNLETIIDTASRAVDPRRFRAAGMEYVVYVRPGVDPLPIARTLESWLPGHRGYRLMTADICRSDLLLEIEAMSLSNWEDQDS